MKKTTGKVIFQSDPDFDWSLYENGYEGGSSLYVNKSVKTKGKDKVFCHEPYAQELYDAMEAFMSGKTVTAKDSIVGTTYKVDEIRVVSDHELRVDTDNGMSAIIDINKETQYAKHFGFENGKEFIGALRKDENFRKNFAEREITVKVVSGNKISLWEGYKSSVEKDFDADLERQRRGEMPNYAYDGKIVGVNQGGFVVDVLGVQCFMPVRLASAGKIDSLEDNLGKTVKVCVVNYSPRSNNYVVSYKRYLEIILPDKIQKELYVGKEVQVKCTGPSRNALFCSIKDENGEFIFTSLIHRSTMSKDFEESFDNGEFIVGDQFRAYVYALNWEDDGTCKIVLTDRSDNVPKANKD